MEFVLGTVGCLALGVWALVSARDWVWLGVGAWLVGIGANYIPLALYAKSLSAAGRLEAEIGEAAVRAELRRAGVQQLWIAVPFSVAAATLVVEIGVRRR